MKKALKAIWAIIRNPWLLNNILSDDSFWWESIKKRHGVDSLRMIDYDDICTEDTLNTFAFLDGGSLPTDILLLKSMAQRFDNCKYFEIGTWRGESVVNVAEVSSEAYTLSLSSEELVNDLGQSQKYADLHEFFSKGNEKIIHLKGNSMNYDFAGLNKRFDLIFIDGNHHYEYAKKDTKKVFEHLVHDNSIVVWHDCAYSPEKQRPEVISAILDGVPVECKDSIYHVSNTLSAVYIKGDFNSTRLETPVFPDKKFRVVVESKDL